MGNKEQIDNEINMLASRMAKSAQDPKQTLFDTIMELGPEGLKKAAANLSPAETELLKASLEEMKKAANMPKPTEDGKKLAPEVTKTPAKKMETESQTGSDDEDEKKIMASASAEHKAQGGPKDSPLEGQVIKGREPGMEHRTDSGAIIIGHTSTGKPMYANAEHPAHKDMGHKDHKEAASMHQGHASQIRSQMDQSEKDEKGEPKDKPRHLEMFSQARMHENQAMEHMKQGAKKEDAEMKKNCSPGMMKSMRKAVKQVAFEGGDLKKAYENFMSKSEEKEKQKMEKREDSKVDSPSEEKKEVPSAEKLEKKKMKKAKKIEKSLRKIVKMAKSLKMTKEDLSKAVKEAGNNLKLVKAELKAKLIKAEAMDAVKPAPEEDQVKMGGQDKGGKEEKINKEKGELEIKAETEADQVKAPMAKSVQWTFKNSIGAGTLGRNAHYDVDAFIEKSEAEKQEAIKKGAYIGEKETEPLKKAEGQKADLNDLIEKGLDFSTDEIKRIQEVSAHKVDGIKLVKSFSDRELAAALGMDEKTYKELMGSDKE